MRSTHASIELRNSSPSPSRRVSYQIYASAISRSASGAKTRLTAMPGARPLLHVLPGQPRGRVFQEVRLSARKFLLLPVVNRHCLRRASKVIPEVLYQLKLLGRAEVKDRWSRVAHSTLRCPFSQKHGFSSTLR